METSTRKNEELMQNWNIRLNLAIKAKENTENNAYIQSW